MNSFSILSGDPIQWHLDAEDLLTSNDDETSVKCLNCRHYGHNEDKCSLPPKEVVCFMCGIAGHSKTKCPNSICLNVRNTRGDTHDRLILKFSPNIF